MVIYGNGQVRGPVTRGIVAPRHVGARCPSALCPLRACAQPAQMLFGTWHFTKAVEERFHEYLVRSRLVDLVPVEFQPWLAAQQVLDALVGEGEDDPLRWLDDIELPDAWGAGLEEAVGALTPDDSLELRSGWQSS